MCRKDRDICNDYGFCFMDHVEEPAIVLDAVGWQRRNDGGYYWKNQNRPECFLFQYTLSGSGTLETEDGIFTVKKGEGFFLRMPGEESYYFDEEKNQGPWEFVYLMFRGRSVSAYYEYVLGHVGKMIALASHHPAVKQLMDLYFQAKKGLIQNAFMAEKEAFGFLCALCDASIAKECHSSLMDRAKAYMEQNFDQPITLLKAAEELGVSQSHLSREFVKYTGEHPIRYLTKVRLEYAIKLLHSTDMRLEEVSVCCGFSDGNYFSRVFKKYMKVSPGEFRKQMRAQGYVSVKV